MVPRSTGWQIAPSSGAAAPATLQGAVLGLLLLLIWISTEPFKVTGLEPDLGGNVINQIVFSLAALFAIVTVALSDRRALSAYLRPAYLAMLAWMLFCVIVSINPALSIRAFAFTGIVMVIACVSLVLATTQRQFALILGLAALATVLICYAGLVVFPETAMHTHGDRVEPEHAGSWRGLYDHKNIAGAMMSFFAMIGLYVAAVRSRVLGYTLFGLSAVFLGFTMAKTSIGLFPLTLLLAAIVERIRGPGLRAIVCLAPLALMLTFTVGSVLLPPVHALLNTLSPGQTFTGRTEIWGFVFDRLADRPFTGYGFEAFWGSDFVTGAETGEDETGIAQGIVHGHNSYVDVVISMGLPGLALIALILVFLPLADYAKSRRFAENADLSRLYLRIWLFAIHAACLESFFFRRADPVWFTLVFAVLGLRLVSLWRVAR